MEADLTWAQLARQLASTAIRPVFGGIFLGWVVGIVAQWVAAGFIYGNRITEAERSRERRRTLVDLVTYGGIALGAYGMGTLLASWLGDQGLLGSVIVGGGYIFGGVVGGFIGVFAASILGPKSR